MDDGIDEEEARAARMDEWIVWEAGRGKRGRRRDYYLFLMFFSHFVRRTHTPRWAHSAMLRMTDFLCM